MSTTHQSEKDLKKEFEQIKMAQKDPDKFELLYDKYYHEIFRFIYKRTQASDTTSDIASRVFLKAMINIRKYQFKGVPFSAWLIRIAINEINYHYRKKKKEQQVVIEEADLKNILSDVEEPDYEEKLIALQNAMNHLNEKSAQLIELRYFENLQFNEIATILNISISSAKMNVYRTLEKLKILINKYLDD